MHDHWGNTLQNYIWILNTHWAPGGVLNHGVDFLLQLHYIMGASQGPVGFLFYQEI